MTRNKQHEASEHLNDFGKVTLDPQFQSNDLSAIKFFHKLPQIAGLKELLCSRLNTALSILDTPNGGVYRFYLADDQKLYRDLFALELVFHPAYQEKNLLPNKDDLQLCEIHLGAFFLQPELSFFSFCVNADEGHRRCFDVARSVMSSLMEILNHAFINCLYITELTQNRKQFLNYLRKWQAVLNDPIYLNYLFSNNFQTDTRA